MEKWRCDLTVAYLEDRILLDIASDKEISLYNKYIFDGYFTKEDIRTLKRIQRRMEKESNQ